MSLSLYWNMLFSINNFNEYFERVLILTGISILLVLAFNFFFLFKINFKSVDYLWVVKCRQALVSFIASAYIWGLFSILFATLLWFGLFLYLRFYGFSSCSKSRNKSTDLFNKNNYILNSENNLKLAFFNPFECKAFGYTYSFNSYANSLAILIIFCVFGLASPIPYSVCFTLFALEFFIVATAVYYFLCKGIYYIALFSPSSLTYLCTGLSYIPVIVFGVVYYFISVIIMITTSVGWKSW